MRRILALLVFCFALLGDHRAAAAQEQSSLPRPKLSRSADTNDWQSYFDYAVSVMESYPNRADTALRWAIRLDPTRADPLFARWVAFWLRDLTRFQEWWFQDRAPTQDSAAVWSADSLYRRALQRNPFVPHMLLLHPFKKLPGAWRESWALKGINAYARLDFVKAADFFARQLAQAPDEDLAWRWWRALAFVGAKSYDSARSEMIASAATLRAHAEREISPWYQSIEMTEFSIGMLDLVEGRVAPAREAFQKALVENLGFFPAHAMLGDIALATGNAAAAAREFGQAAELAPEEAWIQYRFGAALTRINRAADAIAPLKRAIALAPFFADPYLALGDALAAVGDGAGAVSAYDDYLRRAPRRSAPRIEYAQRRLEALRGTP